VLDGELLYTTSRAGEVFCFEAESGKVVWKRHLVEESLAREPSWGFCASAAVDGDFVILNAGASGMALN
jgi:outer membrane protein assembly factor BamB